MSKTTVAPPTQTQNLHPPRPRSHHHPALALTLLQTHSCFAPILPLLLFTPFSNYRPSPAPLPHLSRTSPTPLPHLSRPSPAPLPHLSRTSPAPLLHLSRPYFISSPRETFPKYRRPPLLTSLDQLLLIIQILFTFLQNKLS